MLIDNIVPKVDMEIYRSERFSNSKLDYDVVQNREYPSSHSFKQFQGRSIDDAQTIVWIWPRANFPPPILRSVPLFSCP